MYRAAGKHHVLQRGHHAAQFSHQGTHRDKLHRAQRVAIQPGRLLDPKPWCNLTFIPPPLAVVIRPFTRATEKSIPARAAGILKRLGEGDARRDTQRNHPSLWPNCASRSRPVLTMRHVVPQISKLRRRVGCLPFHLQALVALHDNPLS